MIIHGGINSTYGAVATDGVQDYVWIPRFAYQKENKEKVFVREISRISTYDKGLREENWIVPSEFEEKTGIWRLKEDLEKELEDLTTITLTYDKNCEEEVTNLPEEIIVDPNVEIEISSLIPERENYLFKEWNTQADGTGTTYQPGDKIIITNDITLYAIWDYKYVTITYDKNCTEEVTNVPSAMVIEKGIETEISTAIPEREGYAFKHWCTGANGTETIYQPGDEITITKDITLYAMWKPKEKILIKLTEYDTIFDYNESLLNNISKFNIYFIDSLPTQRELTVVESDGSNYPGYRLYFNENYKIEILQENPEYSLLSFAWGDEFDEWVWTGYLDGDYDISQSLYCIVEIIYQNNEGDTSENVRSRGSIHLSVGDDDDGEPIWKKSDWPYNSYVAYDDIMTVAGQDYLRIHQLTFEL